MRDPNRLDAIYKQMLSDHKNYFPDWRFGQAMQNFIDEVQGNTKKDLYYLNDAEILAHWNKFTERMKGHRG